MKKLLVLLLALTLVLYAFPAPAEQDDTEEIFDRGIAAYSSGDFVAALEAFTTCRDRGLVVAYYCLGVMYAYGEGVEQNYEQAAEYVKVSAEYDHPESLYFLGLMYQRGVGVEQSDELALEHFRKAAGLGYQPAQEMLDSLPKEGEELSPEEQLRRKAVNVGMELPEPGEGERLYLGVASVPDTKLAEIFVALVAAPNLMTFHSVIIYGYGLEVPKESGEPYLINSMHSSAEDAVISRDAKSGISGFTLGEEITVEQLTLDETGGSCNVTMTGTYEKESENVKGTYRASAAVTLTNLSGDTAMDPIDPPTLEQVRSAGMTIPEPAEGETLFIGQANITQAKTAYLVFVRTADGKQIRDLSYLLLDMALEYRTETSRTNVTVSKSSGTVPKPVDVGEDLSFGRLSLSRFSMEEDTASGILHFSYQDTNHTLDYPLDPAWIRFVKAE